MPLDVQPLSPFRRLLAVLLLLALLGGALGFAEILVVRHRGVARNAGVLPGNFSNPVSLTPAVPGFIGGGSGAVDGRPRAVCLFSQDTAPLSLGELSLRTATLFADIMQVPPAQLSAATLAMHPAIEASGQDAAGNFALVRMAVAEHTALAICYSGPGPMTDADQKYFEQLSRTVFSVRDAKPGPGK